MRLGLSLRPSCVLVLIVWRKEDIRLISVSPARYNSRVFIDRNLPKNKQTSFLVFTLLASLVKNCTLDG